jgi:hypothetical protein
MIESAVRTRAAISIDLDPLADAGDAATATDADESLYGDAVPRWATLLAEFGAHATFFVVGRDAARPGPARTLRALTAAGHELANHTWDHPVAFGRLPPRDKEEQIDRAAGAIADASGEAVRGFRAPAWDIDATTVQLLEGRAYLYDSSIVPSPFWPSVRIVYRLLRGGAGRRLGGGWSWRRAPLAPYHPDASDPARVGALRLVELPVAATAGPRIPFWMSPALVGGTLFVDAIGLLLRRHPAPQWLMHGVDLVDDRCVRRSATVGSAYLRRRLRRPLVQREAIIRRALAQFTSRFAVTPLRELAHAASGT